MPECRRRGQTRHFSSSGTGKIGNSTWLVWCLKEPDNTVLVYRFLRGTTSGSNRFGGGSPMVCQPCPQTGEPPTCNHNRWGRIPTNCKVCRRVVFVGKNNALPRNILCSMRCATYHQSQRTKAWRHAQRAARNLAAQCDACGSSFTPARISARYCSPACRQSAYRARLLKSLPA